MVKKAILEKVTLVINPIFSKTLLLPKNHKVVSAKQIRNFNKLQKQRSSLYISSLKMKMNASFHMSDQTHQVAYYSTLIEQRKALMNGKFNIPLLSFYKHRKNEDGSIRTDDHVLEAYNKEQDLWNNELFPKEAQEALNDSVFP